MAVDDLGHAGVALGHHRQVGPRQVHGVDHGLDLVGAVAAVPANRGEPKLRQGVDRVGGAHAHHREAARVEGHRGDNGQLGRPFACALNGGAHLVQVAHRLDPERVGAACGQAHGLCGEALHGDRVGQLAHGLEQLAAGADRARHKRSLARLGLRQHGGRLVQLKDLALEVMQLQAKRAAAEAVGQDHLGARLHVAAMDGGHQPGPGRIDVPLLWWVAKQQARLHQHGAHAAIEDHRRAAAKEGREVSGHCLPL